MMDDVGSQIVSSRMMDGVGSQIVSEVGIFIASQSCKIYLLP